jgi:hypothetical protein
MKKYIVVMLVILSLLGLILTGIGAKKISWVLLDYTNDNISDARYQVSFNKTNITVDYQDIYGEASLGQESYNTKTHTLEQDTFLPWTYPFPY